MDDYKRTLYMQVLTALYQARKNYALAFICQELRRTIYNEQSDYYRPSMIDNYVELLDKFFPEFYAMFDSMCYQPDGDRYSIQIIRCWWEPGWIEPRIRALECILRD